MNKCRNRVIDKRLQYHQKSIDYWAAMLDNWKFDSCMRTMCNDEIDRLVRLTRRMSKLKK